MRIIRSRIDTVPLVPGGRRGLVLSLVDDAGLVGLGEATPLPGFSPDDAEACHCALRDALPRLRAFATADCLAAPDLPAARFALETALLDLEGQRLGRSVATLLGGPRPYTEIPVNGLLSASDELPALLSRARALIARRIGCIKIKLRARDEEGFCRELDALIALRRELEAIGAGEIELRLDANGAWTEDEARRRLEALAPLGPRFVEQPVPADRLDRLGQCAVPWAADESLGVPGMAERLLEAEGCAAFVLKPAALGLLRAHEIARLAMARGLGVVVTHLMDGPIALAAACSLALALPGPPLACGLDDHPGLALWRAISIPQRRGALIADCDRPGLGLPPGLDGGPWTTA